MKTLEEVAKQFDITLDQAKVLKQGMSLTWDRIAHDCYEYLSFFDSEADMIAEMTLDAGRLEQHTNGCLDWTWLDAEGLDAIALGKATWEARL
tara:strand:- start:295 stop:573 length:279 start_codon:yes stop_codon:yes gene_type:complete